MKLQRIPRLDSPLLPLQQGAIFVDWHGVTSNDVFWSTILNDESHRYFPQMKAATVQLFSEQKSRVLDWMRGSVNYRDIIQSLALPDELKARADYLEQLLIQDCKRMTGDHRLLRRLGQLKSTHYIVLATDNMDCFSMVVDRMPWVRATFDSLLCSSEIGVTKADDIGQFFGPWLSYHGLRFEDSVLIDDSLQNCSRFEDFGGRSIRVKDMSRALADLDDIVRHF